MNDTARMARLVSDLSDMAKFGYFLCGERNVAARSRKIARKWTGLPLLQWNHPKSDRHLDIPESTIVDHLLEEVVHRIC